MFMQHQFLNSPSTMHLKNNAHNPSQILFYNDLLTCIYLPLLTAYLYYSHQWLTIGQFENISFIAVLFFLEIVKYVFYVSKAKPKQSIREFLKRILSIVLLFSVIYVISVLFGAPVFSKFEETYMFSLLLTVLTAFPLCMYFGAENGVTLFLTINSSEDNEIQKSFVIKVRLSVLGAWLGATVIPLDWNRPWQDWPIPCSVGIILGHIVAVWICTFLQYHNRAGNSKKTEKHV